MHNKYIHIEVQAFKESPTGPGNHGIGFVNTYLGKKKICVPRSGKYLTTT